VLSTHAFFQLDSYPRLRGVLPGDTRKLVSEHWAEIEAVARALEEKNGTLDGPEVVRIIEQANRASGVAGCRGSQTARVTRRTFI